MAETVYRGAQRSPDTLTALYWLDQPITAIVDLVRLGILGL